MSDALDIVREIAAQPCTMGCEARLVQAAEEGKLGAVVCLVCRARATLKKMPAVTIRIRDLADGSVMLDVDTNPPNLGEAKTAAQKIGLLTADYAMKIITASAVEQPTVRIEPTEEKDAG